MRWSCRKTGWNVWLFSLCLAAVGCDGKSQQSATDGQGGDSTLRDLGNSEGASTALEMSVRGPGDLSLDGVDRGGLSPETETADWQSECDSCGAERECSNGLCVPSGMVGVPEGEFWMGCNLEHDKFCKEMLPGDAIEVPFHAVWLDSFAIDVTEVTVSAYMQCVLDGHCKRPDWGKKWPESCSHPLGVEEDPDGYDPSLPITCVNWFQALDFCQWSGKRLCTEAEWEKAARGPDSLVYPWGNSPPTCELVPYMHIACCDPECPEIGTKPVGSFPLGASPYGALDMAGNVEEWVADWFDDFYYYVTPYENPQGPSWGKEKGLRGGHYQAPEKYMRTSSRGDMGPTADMEMWGFRCCFSL